MPSATSRPIPPEFRRVSSLLNFESDTDSLFISADPGPARLDTAHARSGQSSLVIPAGTRRVSIKLASLVSGREFPGTWTLAGLHVYSAQPAELTLSITSGETLLVTRKLAIAPDQWTAALLDIGPLANLPAPAADSLRLVVDFPKPLASDLWLDDVLLADNAHTLVDPSEGIDGQGWTVRREGFRWIIDRPQRFHIILPTDELAGGWRNEEADRVRARFHSDTGETKSLTLYFDGRSYWDSAYKPLSIIDAGPAYAPQHRHPAVVRVPEDQGRLDRNTPGDANHDGYNESTGAYTLVADGRHMEVSVSPHPDPLLRPVFEIRKLPPGDVRASVEGTLAEDVLRLPDGRVLIIAPGLIQRPTTLDVRVR